jgi:hypothetical protein
VIVGLALFILAAVFAYKGSVFLSAPVLASLIIGTLMLVGAAFWNYSMVEPKAMYRRGLFWLNVVVTSSMLAGTIIILNVLVAQYGPPHLDWTSEKTFTLAPQSKSIVKSLEKPVKFIGLYRRGGAAQRQLDQLFELYKHESNMVSYEFIDMVEENIRTKEMFEKFPDANLREEVVIVTYGSGDKPEHKIVKDSEVMSMKASLSMESGINPEKTEFNGEAAITAAIIQLMDEKKTNVYFTTGHGELDTTNTDERGEGALDGIGLIKEAMTALNIKVETIDLNQKEVPTDADLIIIAGPKSPFDPSEVQKLRDFMDRRDKSGVRSSRMLVMLDPVPDMRKGAAHDAELGEFLASFQVQVKDNLVVDLAAAYQRRPEQVRVTLGDSKRSHPILNGLAGEQTLMIHAREISPVGGSAPPGPGEPPKPYQATTLFSTTAGTNPLNNEPISWGEGSYETSRIAPGGANDSPGPVSLAVAVSEEEGPPPQANPFGPPPKKGKSNARLVVFGDSSFASNYVAGRIAPASRDLFMNTVNWLRGRLELVDIPPRTKKSTKMTIDDKMYYRMLFVPTGMMFVFLVTIAGLVWIVRHRY